MQKSRGGSVCAANDCNNKGYNCTERFHMFPRDHNRAKQWLLACNRLDLIEKLNNNTFIFKNYRLCGSHFEDNMVDQQHKRRNLKKNAVPTIFSSSKLIVPKEEPWFVPDETRNRPSTSSDLTQQLDSSSPTIQSLQSTTTLFNTIEIQTPMCFSYNTPRSSKLTNRIENLKREIKKLKRENEQLHFRLRNIPNEVTIEDYRQLTHKFCPSKEIAELINFQITKINKTPKSRIYSDKFKHKCLSMYFAGPKLYKTILSKVFCLLHPQTLKKLLQGLNH